jgi:LAO/AO transport system kinase
MASRKRGRTGSSSPEVLAHNVRAGDRQALARAITLIESTRADHRAAAGALLDQLTPHAGSSVRIGISGAPGVGKSTLIEAIGKIIVGAGHRLAVLSVDPTSSVSGGSILGDKTRMAEIARREDVFIRPSPAGSTLGGVARRTRESLIACEAAGYDVVIVETVGVGQSETAVAEMTDLFVLLLMPEGGDELQGMKKGIFELADIVVVNKADGPLRGAAEKSAAAARSALSLTHSGRSAWTVPVLCCSARENSGVAEIWETVLLLRNHLNRSGQIDRRRGDQARAWMWAETTESLLAALREHPEIRARVPDLEKIVTAGELPPPAAARALLDTFLSSGAGGSDRSTIGRLNHVAIAVPKLGKAASLYRDALGADVSDPISLPDHGVTVVFAELPNTRVELMEPRGEKSPIAPFLKNTPSGGIHHLCFEVGDLAATTARLAAGGARVLDGGLPKIGAHGKQVVFLHPKDFCGTLIELAQA